MNWHQIETSSAMSFLTKWFGNLILPVYVDDHYGHWLNYHQELKYKPSEWKQRYVRSIDPSTTVDTSANIPTAQIKMDQSEFEPASALQFWTGWLGNLVGANEIAEYHDPNSSYNKVFQHNKILQHLVSNVNIHSAQVQKTAVL